MALTCMQAYYYVVLICTTLKIYGIVFSRIPHKHFCSPPPPILPSCRLVNVGDTVTMGDAVCEVQSDKVAI